MRVVALLCVCVVFGFAATGSALAAGSISGTVTEEAAGHAAIEDVRVCAFEESAEEPEWVAELGVNCELTDASGDYTIADLPEAEYAVQFWPGYEGLNYLAEYYDDKPSWFEADLVEVTNGAKNGIDAELAEGGQVHGKVVNEFGGAPLSEIVVCVEGEVSPWYFECAVTDAAGEYTIPGIPAGEYWLEFWSEDQSFIGKVESGVAVAVGAITQKDAALAPAARITGQVTDAVTHVGVEEILVCAIELPELEFVRCTETGPFGQYTLGRLAPATYKVVFAAAAEEEEPWGAEADYRRQYYNGKPTLAAADPISLGIGATRGGIDAALVKKKAAAVVVPPPAPLAAAPFVARPAKKLHCRKGFHKRKVKGKIKCVKPRKKKHRGHALHLRARLR